MPKEWRKCNPDFKNVPVVGWVDRCFEITGSSDDCNEHRHEIGRSLHFPFTLAEITRIVNDILGCSFDEVAVAPNNAGYRVHGPRVNGMPTYRFGDEFVLDEATTRRVDEIEAHWRAEQKATGQKYPCVGVWRDENDSDLVHVRNFNKSGLGEFNYRVDEEDWRATEVALPPQAVGGS